MHLLLHLVHNLRSVNHLHQRFRVDLVLQHLDNPLRLVILADLVNRRHRLVRRQVLVQCLLVQAADLHLSHSRHRGLDLEVFPEVHQRSEARVVALGQVRALLDQRDDERCYSEKHVHRNNSKK